MDRPYNDTVTLYNMMATPGKNKEIREYIEFLESEVTRLTQIDNSNYHKMKDDFDEFESRVERKLKRSNLFWDSLD